MSDTPNPPTEPPAGSNDAPAGKPTITYDDFAKIDLKVAVVTEAREHPNADKLLVLSLDDGSGTPRQICAGIRGHYEPASLVGKQIIIVANLAPRKLRGEVSQGMLLAASPEDHSQIVVLSPSSPAAAGWSVS